MGGRAGRSTPSDAKYRWQFLESISGSLVAYSSLVCFVASKESASGVVGLLGAGVTRAQVGK